MQLRGFARWACAAATGARRWSEWWPRGLGWGRSECMLAGWLPGQHGLATLAQVELHTAHTLCSRMHASHTPCAAACQTPPGQRADATTSRAPAMAHTKPSHCGWTTWLTALKGLAAVREGLRCLAHGLAWAAWRGGSAWIGLSGFPASFNATLPTPAAPAAAVRSVAVAATLSCPSGMSIAGARYNRLRRNETPWDDENLAIFGYVWSLYQPPDTVGQSGLEMVSARARPCQASSGRLHLAARQPFELRHPP